jgi:hypothetical protein
MMVPARHLRARLGLPIARAQQRIDVHESVLLDAGQQRHPMRERHQMRGRWLACPKVNSRRKIPSVGAYTWSNTRGVPPACSTPASSMLVRAALHRGDD